jgi:uncharacterized membrane protein YbaN (DUF454 family)
VRLLYNVAGCICVALAFLGLFLPSLPTTPFLLLAAYCFCEGQPECTGGCSNILGWDRLSSDWNEHRIVRPRVKLVAAAAIVLLMGPALIFGNLSPILKTASIIVGLAVIGIIGRQPSR